MIVLELNVEQAELMLGALRVWSDYTGGDPEITKLMVKLDNKLDEIED